MIWLLPIKFLWLFVIYISSLLGPQLCRSALVINTLICDRTVYNWLNWKIPNQSNLSWCWNYKKKTQTICHIPIVAAFFSLHHEKDATRSVSERMHVNVTTEPRSISFPVPSNAEKVSYFHKSTRKQAHICSYYMIAN